jgi:hypothetical protein
VATSELKVKTGAQFTFADHATDFVGGTAKTSLEQAGSTDVQINCVDLADGAGRESVKVDLGATRAARYGFMAAIEFETSPLPTSGKTVDLYWAPSPDSVATDGNPMQIDGADAAAPSGIGDLAELVLACQRIGSFVVSDDGATQGVQVGFVGIFSPSERYGILLVVNNGGNGAAFRSGMEQTHFVMTEILDESQ